MTVHAMPNLNARNTDPETSHEAARSIQASGRQETNIAKVVEIVSHNEGLTAGEICALLNDPTMDYHETVRRLSDAKNRRILYSASPRLCTVRPSNRKSGTWFVQRPAQELSNAA